MSNREAVRELRFTLTEAIDKLSDLAANGLEWHAGYEAGKAEARAAVNADWERRLAGWEPSNVLNAIAGHLQANMPPRSTPTSERVIYLRLIALLDELSITGIEHSGLAAARKAVLG